jgi:NADPH-dependent 2,4-dienoyl-CoA reductase/sulfur reductase-like enzyme
MRTMDPDMAELIEKAMARHGVELITGVGVVGFEPGRVLLDSGSVEADLVVLGIGVSPSTDLARGAGLTTGDRGAVVVDRCQRTSAEGVWAAGDCATSHHLLLDRPVHVALGTVANRQGRVAGINIGGGYATFPGVVGTAITRFWSTEIARTGLSEHEATTGGFRYVVGRIEGRTRAHYFPGAAPITVKVLAEQGTGRLLGAQIVGGEGAGKRIDTMATAITAGFTVHDMVNLDLAYAPPFAPVWDPVVMAARDALRRL